MMKINLKLLLVIVLVFCTSQVLTCSPCKFALSKQFKVMHADCTRHTLDMIMTNIPDNLDSQIESISLQEQLLKHIGEEAFSTIHLRIVNLEKCKIESVDKNAFINLRNLSELNLAYNDIETLDRDTFKFNKNLKSIRLNNNKLKTIHDGLFAVLMLLNKLYLNNNKISDIHRLAFATNVNIKSLFLQNNQLSHIDPYVITNLQQLFEIYLDGNPWSCDCRLRQLHDYLLEHQFYGINARCQEPEKFRDLAWIDLSSIDFSCWINTTWYENVTKVLAHSEAVTFYCTFIAFPKPNLTWTYNGHVINLTDHYRYIYPYNTLYTSSLEFVSRLTILYLTTADNGEYKCKIQNYDQEEEKSFILTVQPARGPVILWPNETVIDVDVYTENVTLSCKVSGIPAPNISWIRVGFNYTIGHRYISSNAIPNTDNYWINLTFPRLTVYNGGAYTCRAQNTRGIMEKTIWLNVRELQPPKSIETKSYYKPIVTTNVTLVCGVKAVPKPKLGWKYEYIPLDPKVLSEKYSGDVVRDKYGIYWYNLTILNVRPEDSGKYFCAVSNSEGFYEKIIRVDVKQQENLVDPMTLTVYVVIGCGLFGILLIIFIVKCLSRYCALKHFSHEILYRQSYKE